MGIRIGRATYELTLKDPKYAGVEVTAYELTTGELWEFMELEKVGNGSSEEAKKARVRVLEMLAGALVSWNVDDMDGNPVPMTVDGLLARGHHFNAQLMDSWTDALVGIPAPLSQTSSGGQPSLEASIPMESPSESLAS